MRNNPDKLPPVVHASILAGLQLGILENRGMVNGRWLRRMRPEYQKLGPPENWPPELISPYSALVEKLLRSHTPQELADMVNAGGELNLSMNRQ
jgi:hypothetical protein